MVATNTEIGLSTVHLEVALASFIKPGNLTNRLACVLSLASECSTVSFEQIEEITGNDTEDVLLLSWEWRLLIPVRTFSCHEWDHRIQLMQSGETYEMPNVSRLLVQFAAKTGKWDSTQAITEFFKISGASQYTQIPRLVERMREGCPAIGINARQIRIACLEMGFGEQTDTLIAILKGAGVMSPKLGSLAQVTRTRTPLYELNPCLFVEIQQSH